jgi:peptide deformylase
MAKLKIITEPDPRYGKVSQRLRQKSARIDAVDDDVKQLASDMFDAMLRANGVGLAGPQVGVLRRLVVIQVPEGYEHEDDPELNLVLINPEIVKAGGKDIGPEGCLSFPDLVGDVQRYATVVVKAGDLDGNELRIKARGMLARALQHEIDHLDGILFFDRMEDFSSLRYPRYAEEASEAESAEEAQPSAVGSATTS